MVLGMQGMMQGARQKVNHCTWAFLGWHLGNYLGEPVQWQAMLHPHGPREMGPLPGRKLGERVLTAR